MRINVNNIYKDVYILKHVLGPIKNVITAAAEEFIISFLESFEQEQPKSIM